MRKLILAFVAASIAGCAAQPQRASVRVDRLHDGGRFTHERTTIHALRAANNRAMAARDVDGTMTIVADDYVIVAGNGEIIRSAGAIRTAWSEDFRNPRIVPCVRQPGNIEVGQDGTGLRAAESGRWQCAATMPAGEAVYHGSYFAHWSKGSGEWRVVSDNYVSLGCDGSGCRRE